VAALFCAIENFDNTEVAKIVEAGADINAQGPKGGYEGTDNDLPDLPLCLAVRMSNTEAIHILVEHGANVNGDCFGSSPISNAAGYGQEVLLDYLLQHGADPNKSDTDEMSLSLLMHCVEGPDNTPQEGPTIVTGSAG
jgi:ankyrin repeat protein